MSKLTLEALESGLHKIESSHERKNILNMMYDCCKSGQLAGAHVLRIIINNMQHEEAVDVLVDTLRFIAPTILSSFIHEEVYEARKSEMFDLTMNIMTSGNFKLFPSAMETLLTSSIGFASTEA